MRRALILTVLTLVFMVKAKKEDLKCNGVYLRGKCHSVEVIAKGLNRPYQLSGYKAKPKIFFSFNVGDDKEDTFKIGYIEKDIAGHKTIDEVENGFAIALDQDNHMAYFGGSEGIYKYNLKANTSNIEKIVYGHNIWDMFYKNHLYFITYPSHKLYKFKHEKDKVDIEHQEYIHEKIYQFVIDGNDDIFITNNTGLYRIKSGSDKRIHYKGAEVFRAIEVNYKGEAYFCGQNAIYVANKVNHSLEEIVHIKNIFGLTFDNEDRIIYSNPHEILFISHESK